MSTRHNSGRRRLVAGLAMAATLALSAQPGGADTLKPAAPRRVTGDTPLPLEGTVDPSSNTRVDCGSGRDHQGWEQQPVVAANPGNPDHLVATWIQDWNDATLVGYSTDAGQHWATAIPLTTECTWKMAGRENDAVGNKFDGHNSINDPAVSVGPDGIAYLTSAVFGSDPGYVVVHRSIDGGRTWSDPHELDAAGFTTTGTGVDYTNVVADRARPGHAYALWENGSLRGDKREQYVAKTTDGGEHWSEKVRVPTPDFPGIGQLVVLPDGGVLDVFLEIPPQPGLLPTLLLGPTPPSSSALVGPTKLHVTRSSDGSSWSAPEQIAVADEFGVAAHRVAMAPDGTVYVFWLRADPLAKTHSLMFITSITSPDGGIKWSAPQDAGKVERPSTGSNGMVSAPNVAVTTDGTIGVSFYDHRQDPDNNPPEWTAYWFRHSHDGGSTWTKDELLAGPFNQSSAPDGAAGPDGDDFNGPGNLGDVQGIAAIGNGFGTLFALAQPLGGANFKLASTREPTDLFFMRLKVPGQ